MVSTTSASRQLINSINTAALRMLRIAQVLSSTPHVISSATRSVSDVTRDMIQPTGVRL